METFDHTETGRRGRALVVYESMFGNTEAVAHAVAAGLAEALTTNVVEVTEAPLRFDDDLTLLVVGAPTHAFGLSRPGTRVAAAEQGGRAEATEGVGVREWIAAVHPHRPCIPAALFDTRLRHFPGSAAQAARRRLHRRGFDTTIGPVSFHVKGTPGPLRDRELERAEQWGRWLGQFVSADRTVMTKESM